MATKLLSQRQVNFSAGLILESSTAPANLQANRTLFPERQKISSYLKQTAQIPGLTTGTNKQVLKEHNISTGIATVDISSLRIYALNTETSTNDPISACYSINADVQDMLAALPVRNDSIRK
jgi:hypothetical protein